MRTWVVYRAFYHSVASAQDGCHDPECNRRVGTQIIASGEKENALLAKLLL